jgi:hypothetical protein
MIKRLLVIVALGAALVACTPAENGAGSPGVETLAPIESMPAESMPAESMSPAP